MINIFHNSFIFLTMGVSEQTRGVLERPNLLRVEESLLIFNRIVLGRCQSGSKGLVYSYRKPHQSDPRGGPSRLAR